MKILKRLQDQDGLEMTPVKFECELNKPNIPVEWTFNDQPIEKCLPADSYIIEQLDNKYTLILPKCLPQNQGIFALSVPGSSLRTKAILNVDGIYSSFIFNLFIFIFEIFFCMFIK